MNDTHPDERFDPQKGLPPALPDERGQVATRTDGDTPIPVESDSPTEGTVPGPRAPEPEHDNEVRPHPEND